MANSSFEIDEKVKDKLYFQDYSPKEVIEGVKIIKLQNHVDEESDFCEVIRVNGNGEVESCPGFVLKQINRTRIHPNAVKAWHIHSKQDELWYVVSSGHMVVGLWDLRKNSKTNRKVMRIVLGGGNNHLLYIPHGVAHGMANFTNKLVNLLYLINAQFSSTSPDEGRLPWDSLGRDFWQPARD